MRDEKRGLFFEVLLLKKIEPKTAETVGAVGLNGNGTKIGTKKNARDNLDVLANFFRMCYSIYAGLGPRLASYFIIALFLNGCQEV